MDVWSTKRDPSSIEVSGELAKEALWAAGYQGSMEQKAAAAEKKKVSEEKVASTPALRTPKYMALQKKDEAATQGEESEDKFDAMMDNQLGIDADKVPVRDDGELVTCMSVKMTVIEGMHPLEDS